jgi:signal peptidase I
VVSSPPSSKSKPATGKLRKSAEDQQRLLEKVYHFRRDLLKEAEVERILAVAGRLEELRKNKSASFEDLAAATEEAETVLKAHGGTYYHKRFWSENVDMFLVAAILAIGVRTFFFQPFKIPTNSMYPSYNGMTWEVYEEPKEEPGAIGQVLRLVTLGSSLYRMEAPASGELRIPIHTNGRDFRVAGRGVPGRKWLILPTTLAEYTFLVGNTPVSLRLPAEFNFDKLVKEIYGDSAEGRLEVLPGRGPVLRTGKRVEKGDSVLAFEILTGDQLFVDRMTYHFRAPQAGDPFVFRTDEVPGIDADNRGKYYIKRLAGEPGDTLQIDPPKLLRNGQPADAAKAFVKNNETEGKFEGYSLNPAQMPHAGGGRPFTIPEENYYALGDNSDESADSRYWGFVPEKEIVGRAIFIYYPFSHRWGRAD